MGLEIGVATPAQRADWLRLRGALWPGPEDEHAREVDSLIAGGEGDWPQVALLAQVGGAVVGLAEVSVRPCAEGCETTDVGYLEGWFVVPELRGTGVGRALLEAAQDWARERGCAEFASDTEHDNDLSRRAHLACGFEDAGLVRCFVKSLERRPGSVRNVQPGG
ncbi:GNAT family N-acetyltransferase [Engelhardtia mirabilis]|uniref:Aminoglycoside N(6')-acetyltransferase type 1 n=1 Tax=Engelhardtia mirabilis TaxID=2528011 RepID=A0A518BE18_9BACT|nr:Aminoglycoside N(6')-acetyltransferase type 1 [Planctomycetes bacterium Pla133]QDU99542.1 Aminoglycoside N(6')-acetyltransferase type 1 [Planctomycetes bacterium Pla86]